jgi:hypothetical protein
METLCHGLQSKVPTIDDQVEVSPLILNSCRPPEQREALPALWQGWKHAAAQVNSRYSRFARVVNPQ